MPLPSVTHVPPLVTEQYDPPDVTVNVEAGGGDENGGGAGGNAPKSGWLMRGV